QTFNISTASSLLVAASGVQVAKHGNRSVSSQCGSADVLEALGIPLHQSSETAISALKADGYAFLFAPSFHPALKKVAQIRKNLGVRTVFNILGPLLNPAPIDSQVLGTFSKELLPKMIDALKNLG